MAAIKTDVAAIGRLAEEAMAAGNKVVAEASSILTAIQHKQLDIVSLGGLETQVGVLTRITEHLNKLFRGLAVK